MASVHEKRKEKIMKSKGASSQEMAVMV